MLLLHLVGLASGVLLEASCQQHLDDYCRSACDLRHRGCDYPTVARYSGPKEIAWRCYSPSTLDHNQTYHGGDCYCSRDEELQEVLAECFSDVVTVFSSGMKSSNCYRIPTIVRLVSGALLAFAEERIDNCGT